MSNMMIETLFLIFVGAAALSTLLLYARQEVMIAYMLLGVILGAEGMGLINDPHTISELSDFGILFLLFLIGMHLHPSSFLKRLKNTLWSGTVSTGLIIIGVTGVMTALGYSGLYGLVTGVALSFSSTILCLKLLPQTELHNSNKGQVVLNLLLTQDLFAIFALLMIQAMASGGQLYWYEVVSIVVGLPGLVFGAFFIQKQLISPLFRRFYQSREYCFLLSIAWCLLFAQGAEYLELPAEIGAFIAGLSLAADPLSRWLSDQLNPLRDFFLILFFFSLGASLPLSEVAMLWWPIVVLSLSLFVIKPLAFYGASYKQPLNQSERWEVSWRLTQASEFSLLLAYLAESTGVIEEAVMIVIQVATVISLVLSSSLTRRWFKNDGANPPID